MKFKISAFLITWIITTAIYAAPDFISILDSMNNKFENLDNYCCTYYAYTANDKDTLEIDFELYFKKPLLIRSVVISKIRKGTIMIYNINEKPDKIYVKTGDFLAGIFQFIFRKYYFDLNDTNILDTRGNGLHQSHWKWWIDEHIRTIKYVEARFIEKQEILGRKTYLYEVVSNNPEKTLSVKKEYIWVDRINYFPIKYEHYNNENKLIRKHKYKKLKFNNPNLKDELFNVK